MDLAFRELENYDTSTQAALPFSEPWRHLPLSNDEVNSHQIIKVALSKHVFLPRFHRLSRYPWYLAFS